MKSLRNADEEFVAGIIGAIDISGTLVDADTGVFSSFCCFIR